MIPGTIRNHDVLSLPLTSILPDTGRLKQDKTSKDRRPLITRRTDGPRVRENVAG